MRHDLAEPLLAQMGQRVPSKLIDFGAALSDADYLSDSWPYFLGKPEKWAPEYTEWANLDYPRDGDEEWDAFLTALDKIAAAG